MVRAGTVYASLGRRVRSLRERTGLTQDELAREVGLRRTSITNIEGGRQKVLLHTLYGIAEALGVPPESLLEPTREEPNGEIARLLPEGLTPEEQEWATRLLTRGLRG